MSSALLHSVHESTKELRRVAKEIQALAMAFRMTGNPYIEEQLLEFSATLSYIQNDIEDAVNEKINADLKQAYENSAAVVKAALAGITLERQSNGQNKP